jgi:hypothetical protein
LAAVVQKLGELHEGVVNYLKAQVRAKQEWVGMPVPGWRRKGLEWAGLGECVLQDVPAVPHRYNGIVRARQFGRL